MGFKFVWNLKMAGEEGPLDNASERWGWVPARKTFHCPQSLIFRKQFLGIIKLISTRNTKKEQKFMSCVFDEDP